MSEINYEKRFSELEDVSISVPNEVLNGEAVNFEFDEAMQAEFDRQFNDLKVKTKNILVYHLQSNSNGFTELPNEIAVNSAPLEVLDEIYQEFH